MLQQTQVATVIPYFERWMSAFPCVEALAEADEQLVLTKWAGLGYYRRARQLHAGAKHVAENGFPGNAKAWLHVPGVGKYTAGAIASIALGEPTPLVDGNVERVYARLRADPSSGPELHRNSWNWAGDVLDQEHPGEWNQALMELGATICTPKSPKCLFCPVSAHCQALRVGQVELLPIKAPRRRVVEIKRTVLVWEREGKYAIRQIPAGEWWEGMWEFPRGEKQNTASEFTFHQAVTHHRIEFQVYLDADFDEETEVQWRTLEEISLLPLPAPQKRVLTWLTRKRS